MLRRFSTIFTLSFLLVAFMAMTAFSANKPVNKKRSTDQRINKALIYSYPDESIRQEADGSSTLGKSTYTMSAAAVSPGVAIGDTWYDYQHNGTIGRMIDWGNDPSNMAIVHFSWMSLPGAAMVDRKYAYTNYQAQFGLVQSVSTVQPGGEYAGYVNVQSTEDGRAVLGGHNNEGAGYQSQFYYDFSPGGAFWSLNSRVDDSVASYAATPVQAVIWPKFAIQEGTDTVTHVFAQVSAEAAADPQAVYYFRKVSTDTLTDGSLDYSSGSWDYPPYVVDTIYDISQDIVASKTSDKVAMAWTANLNYDANGDQYPVGVCDTCSGTSPFSVQWDNDIYYQTSDDQGATWNPRENITKSRLGEAGYRAYTDLSLTLDAADNVHVAWSAVPWAAEIANVSLDNSCRIFHYSENVPFIRTVANAEWPIENFDCGPGAWNINMSKMQISECDGKIYVLWVQYNDLPNGVVDDCAARATSEFSGSANGELYISVSADGGTTWDAPRNLTNSRTPGCDPSTGGADCESDNWPSMTRFGRQNIAGEDWGGAVVVDPSSSYAGDMYLDVQYVHDRDAGGIVQNEGTWQLSNMNWFRLACVEPVPNPQIGFTPNIVDAPIWTKPGVALDMDLTIENIVNVALNYTATVVEDGGPSGWLGVSGLSGSIPSGLSNVEVGTLHLNQGGIQATEAGLVGRIVFTSNAPTTPDTLHVNLLVVDTLTATTPDTLVGYLSLLVQSNGNYGNSGENRLNLDYVNNLVDCDTLATIYLYDASPLILTEDGTDTTASWSIFGDGWLNANGFKPLGGQAKGSEATFNWYSSGTFTTPDSTIAFEQSFFAPTATGANYIVKALKVWSHDGAAHSGLRIGDAVDWDIPSDTNSINTSAFDVAGKYIYQVGVEYTTSDTLADGTPNPSNCVASTSRFGGMKFLKSVLNGTDLGTDAYSAYTARNDSFVFPNGNFIPGQLWNNMGNSGFTNETSESDQHMVMCYDPGFNLGATDTIIYYTVVATVYNGVAADLGTAMTNAETFASDNNWFTGIGGGGCCVGTRGNVNGDSGDAIDISDLVYLVAFMFQGGAAPDCFEEGDIDGSGGIDISDLVGLVAFMFQGGAPPANCP